MQVFGRGTSCLGSNTFTRSSELNVPVRFTSPEQQRGIIINPGDLIVGDVDGVVVVPPASVEKCLDICQQRLKVDELTMEALLNGAEMGATIEKLRKGVSA